MTPDPRKLKVVMDMPPPKCKRAAVIPRYDQLSHQLLLKYANQLTLLKAEWSWNVPRIVQQSQNTIYKRCMPEVLCFFKAPEPRDGYIWQRPWSQFIADERGHELLGVMRFQTVRPTTQLLLPLKVYPEQSDNTATLKEKARFTTWAQKKL